MSHVNLYLLCIYKSSLPQIKLLSYSFQVFINIKVWSVMADNSVWPNPGNAMRNLMQNAEKHDIWFVVEEEKIGALKVIMVANGPYFEKLLEGSFKEANQKEIVIEGVSDKTFRQIVEFCYVGFIRLDFCHDDEIKSLFAAALQFQLDHLLRGVSNQILKKVTAANWLNWIKIGISNNELNLIEAINKKVDDWLNLCQNCKSKYEIYKN